MRRRACLFAGALLLVSASAAGAADWPVVAGPWTDQLDQPTGLVRGEGFYLSLVKLVLSWLVFLAFLKTVSWINQDATELEQKPSKWNILAVAGFAVGLLLLLWSPSFWLGFPLMLAAAIAPIAVYVRTRNRISPSDKVFTPYHMRVVLAEQLAKVGIKISTEPRKKKGGEPPVNLVSRGGESDLVDKANQVKARNLPGFFPLAEIVHAAQQSRAGIFMLDLSKDGLAVRHQVDGVWRDATGRDRMVGEAVFVAMKALANLPADSKSRQRGEFGVGEGKKIIVCRLTSQPVANGQRALVRFDDGSQRRTRLTDLGLRDKVLESFQEVLSRKQALVLVSAPPGGGLTTLLSGTASGVDRYMRSVIAIEDAGNRDLEVENMPVSTFNAAAGETPDKVMTSVIRQYPDALVVAELMNGETVGLLCEQVLDEKRLVVAAIRAREASESLLRVLALKAPRKEFAKAITAAMNVRLLRKLCDACKTPYQPGEKVLKQLGLPPDKIDTLYKPPSPPDPQDKKAAPPCADCGGVGYRGQAGLFEFLLIDDNVRKALLTESKVEPIRLAARKAGMRTLQEEGILLVAKGVTSLEELTRVLMPEKNES